MSVSVVVDLNCHGASLYGAIRVIRKPDAVNHLNALENVFSFTWAMGHVECLNDRQTGQYNIFKICKPLNTKPLSMENFTGVFYDRRCLICRQVTLQNSSMDSEKLTSNATFLQDFLNCFHINVLDNEVSDLSTLCPFCPTCEQFIAERSSIQTQMTQLTRRAAQLKATISALLLSAPEIQKQNHDDATQTINNKIQNSQEVELPLLLLQTVDDIRNELRRKYLVSVKVDKIELPCPPTDLNQEELDPLSGHSDNDDEPMDDWRGDDESDAEYLPSEDQTGDEETSDQITVMRIKTEEEADSDDSNRHDPLELKEIEATHKSKCPTEVGSQSPTGSRPRRRKTKHRLKNEVIPDVVNGFKYKGLSFQQNEEDQTYTCDTCGFKSKPTLRSICRHLHFSHIRKPSIKKEHSTKKPKQELVVIPDGPNAFKYHGHGLKFKNEDQCYHCGACDFKGTSNIHSVLKHIREIHYTEEDKRKLTAVQTSPGEWLYGGAYKIIAVGEKFRCVSCGSVKPDLYYAIRHIRAEHVDKQGPDKDVPLPVTDTSSVKDLTPTSGELRSVPYTFDPAANKYTCGVCPTEISSRRYLSTHIKLYHTGKSALRQPSAGQKIICEICGKELSNQRGYQEHLKRHQAQPKNCPTCNKRFICAPSFKRHMKIHRLGEAAKKHQCEYCGMTFDLAATYRGHVRIHTGETPFECKVCGKKFRHTSHLSQHRRSAHGVRLRPNHCLMKINEADA